MSYLFLQNNETVQELDLADNILGAEGAKCIAETVAASSSLKKLVSISTTFTTYHG